MQVASVLEDPVKENDTYICIIQNSLVKAISEATVTGKTVDIDKTKEMELIIKQDSPIIIIFTEHCISNQVC